ncbi:hypothetical protein Golax_006154 [Gossypium laxum]|uniref:Uncharacterized protein n=1 Tax=Gossypium laxum TaxID=34288 RepID=A0A7J9A2Y0_9ROSI|nr:hypothetical protein [Gossypium laxum]
MRRKPELLLLLLLVLSLKKLILSINLPLLLLQRGTKEMEVQALTATDDYPDRPDQLPFQKPGKDNFPRKEVEEGLQKLATQQHPNYDILYIAIPKKLVAKEQGVETS